MPSDAEIKNAIARRDVDALLSYFFSGTPPSVRDAFRHESDCWDYKQNCPTLDSRIAWARIAATVMAFYNTAGGIMYFGISNDYSFRGTDTVVDAKQFNDQIRRYTGDKFWVLYNQAYRNSAGLYLGVAVVPKRGIRALPFFTDSPQGPRHFKAGDIAVRVGDETRIHKGEMARKYVAESNIPEGVGPYLVDKPRYRIIAPDWETFVPRETLCQDVLNGLKDRTTVVTSLTGIGGMGKTALACWGVMQAYTEQWFDFIISISAKDRELTANGIREITPTGSTLEHLTNAIIDTIGLPELSALSQSQKESEVRTLISDSRVLLFVDNLETVNPTLVTFLENLPSGVKAILTSRRHLVRKSIFPVEVNPFELHEALAFLDSFAMRKGRSFICDFEQSDKEALVNNCYRIPLLIEWFVGSARDRAAVLDFAASHIHGDSRWTEEVLEFTFRRIHTNLTNDAQTILKILSLFSEPQAIELLQAASSLRMDRIEDALYELQDASLIVRVFDKTLGDINYGMLPVTRRFAYLELTKVSGLEGTMRGALGAWSQGLDISDPAKRRAVIDIRIGKKGSETAYLNAAEQMRSLGKVDAAKEFLFQALQRNSTSWKVHRELADIYRNELQTTSALDHYKKAMYLVPEKGEEQARLFWDYGMLLRDSGEPDALSKATWVFKKAVGEMPTEDLYVFSLGEVLLRRNLFDDARAFLEQLTRSNSRQYRHKTYPLLMSCYVELGDRPALLKLKTIAAKDGFNTSKWRTHSSSRGP
jgi:tetratricopeptide (TPR) repeat protein